MARASGLAYSIHTPRLILRCWHPTDANLLQREINDNLDHLRPWMDWALQEPETLDMKTERLRRFRDDFLARRDFVYGIFAAGGVRIVGGTGLHTRENKDAREIGYWIGRAYSGKGLATESTGALTRVAFEINRVERVEIRCDPRNRASARVAEKLGFLHRTTLYGNKTDAAGELRDTMVWAMDAQEYPGSRASAASVAAYSRARIRIL